MRRRFAQILLAACGLALAWLAYRALIVQPTNQGDWEYGMATLPHVTIAGDAISVQHVRDFRWSPDGPVSSDYVDRTFDLAALERIWFVEEPFNIPPFNGFEGVAHTYFVFDFRGQPPVAVSVEARRHRGQSYDVVSGLFNEYGLIYIWGTEQDLTGSRALLEKNQLYMYPLVGSMDAARRLFLDLAQVSQDLEDHPRFYNSLTSNCTNELARAANAAEPGAIPPNIALLLPGYSDRVLYGLGFIPNDAPLDVERQRYSITETVTRLADQPDFSEALRAHLGISDDT